MRWWRPFISRRVVVELVTSAHLSPDQPTRPVELAPGRLLVSQRLYDRVLAAVPDGERS